MPQIKRTPAEILKEKYIIVPGPDRLIQSYCSQFKVSVTTAFAHLAEYWDQFTPPTSNSSTAMIQMWFIAKMGLVPGAEMEELLTWFFNTQNKHTQQ